MFKFITVTCLLLFFVFYELSGGSDFVPLTERRAAEAAGAAQATTEVAAATAPAASKPEAMARSATRLPARSQPAGVVLASASASDASSSLPSSVTALPLARVSAAPGSRDETPVLGLNEMVKAGQALGEAPGEAPRATAEVLKPQQAAARVPAQAATPARDMRRVTGTTVNLRLGPGTRYNVIGKLNRGDEVEVIGGTGSWLKLKVSDGGRIGWMADWLVTGTRG